MKKTNGNHVEQIDIVKALAIISIIISHTLSIDMLRRTESQFHINEAVILFFIIMGITLTISFNKIKGNITLKKLYSKQYFLKKFDRLIIPFLVIFVISLIWGLLAKKVLYFGPLSFMGLMPVAGPGNYFFSIIIQFILLAPLIYYYYKKYPIQTVLLAYILNLGFELIAPHIGVLNTQTYLYSANIFRYIFVIAFGLFISEEYLSKKKANLLSYRNYAVLLLFPLSVFYLYLGHYSWQPFSFLKYDWGTHNIIAFPYVIVLTVLLLNIDYKKYLDIRTIGFIAIIGQASYHIYLIQMLFFGFRVFGNIQTGILQIIMLNLIATVVLGIMLYYLDTYIRQCILLKRKTV